MRGRRVLALAGGSLFAAWAGYFAVYQVDDAYIVYRYAGNLAEGLGFVFNAGERVEGVTCFLWTIVLAGVAWTGWALPAAGPILTLAAGVGALLLIPGLCARARGRDRVDGWDVAAAALVGAHPGFAFWSVGALETVPYALLLLLALGASRKETSARSFPRSAIWIGLAHWTRPEAPLLAAALALDRGLGAGRAGRRRVLAWVSLVAAIFAPLLAFRALYFGDWVPNTYHAKTGAGLLENARVGSSYVGRFFSSLVPSFGSEGILFQLLGGAAVLYLLASGARRAGTRSAAFLVAALLAAVVVEGGDWMVLYRFLVPALPLLGVLAAARAADWVEKGSAPTPAAEGAIAGPSPRRPGRTAIAAGLGGLLLSSFLVAGVRARDGARGLRVNGEGYRHAHRAVAEFLKERASPGDVVALMDVGIIGYETGLRVIDISGLTSREIARAPGGFLDKRYPVEAILDQAPRFLVLVDGFPIDTRIALHPRFLVSHRLVFERNHRFNWDPPSSYTLHVFERVRDPAAGGEESGRRWW